MSDGRRDPAQPVPEEADAARPQPESGGEPRNRRLGHGRSKPAKDSARREQERERLSLDAKLLEDKSDREGGPKQS